MFHLIIYTEENEDKIENFLTLFENLYDCNGNKIEKKCNEKNNLENYDCKDNTSLKEKLEDKKLKEKELIDYKYELCIKKNKIHYYNSSFLQLYVNSENNFDIYLIDEDETASLGDKNSDNKSSRLKKNEDKKIEEKNYKKDKEYSTSSLNGDSIDINLPLQRSHILFILSIPKYFSFYNFFSLIYEYIDFIVFIKIFNTKSNFSFLKKACDSKDSFSKDQKKYVKKYKNKNKENMEKAKKEEEKHIHKNGIRNNSNEFLNKKKTGIKKENTPKNRNNKPIFKGSKEKLNVENKKSVQNEDNFVNNQKNRENKNITNNTNNRKKEELKKEQKIESKAYYEEKKKNECKQNMNKKEKKKKSDNTTLCSIYEDKGVDCTQKINLKTSKERNSIPQNGESSISLNIDNSNNESNNDKEDTTHDFIGSSSSGIYSDCYSSDLLNKCRTNLKDNTIFNREHSLSSRTSNVKVKKKKKSSNRSTSNLLHTDEEKKNESTNYFSSLSYKEELLLLYQKIYSMLKNNLKKKRKIECYSVLIIFKTQIYADMFYKKFHCKNIDSLMKSKLLESNINMLYENWYIYCVFVNLIYYLVDHKIKNNEINFNNNVNKITDIEEFSKMEIKKENNKLDIYNNKYEKDYKNNSKKISLLENNSNENNLKDRKMDDENILSKKNICESYLREIAITEKKCTLNFFDINNYEKFQRNIITDSNICISVCVMCLELLDNEIYYILTRNKKWNTIKKRNKNFCDYINLSCNVCTLIYFYEVTSKVFNSYIYEHLKRSLNKDELIKILENYLFNEDKIEIQEESYQKGEEKTQKNREGKEEKEKKDRKGEEKEKNDRDENYDHYYNIDKNTIDKTYLLKKRDKMVLKILKLNEIINTLKCKHCENTDDIWLCLICSNIGCSRYQKGHAKMHSSKYNHNYCINLKTRKIWNYLQDTFIKEKMYKQSEESKIDNSDFSFDYYHDYLNNEIKNNNILHNDKEENINEIQNFDADDRYEYNSHIYNKIFDIFTNDIYINDNLKNELLYILYSQLSHESNIYNNILIDIQYKYLNKLESKKKIIKNIHEKINELKNQNKKIESCIADMDNAIKIKNNEKTSIQDKITFFRDLNNNIIIQKKSEKTKIVNNEDENNAKKIKRLNETIKALQSQVDDLLINL